jgi:hypothetical protein
MKTSELMRRAKTSSQPLVAPVAWRPSAKDVKGVEATDDSSTLNAGRFLGPTTNSDCAVTTK